MHDLPFSPATRRWLASAFAAPTRAQLGAWPAIAAGEHTLLVAPTGSGKTLAAFLAGIDRLMALPADAAPGTRLLYLSPLKALVVDVERNLRAPLIGIERAARAAGEAFRPLRVDVRTGDTDNRERLAQRRNPADILVTTPESLYLLLTSGAREALRAVEWVIVDEVHVLAGTKRGVHLQLSLERLVELTGREVQRIGLSATVRPPEVAARFLAGERAVRVVDTSEPPKLDLRVEVPVDDMDHPALPAPPAVPADAFPGFPGATSQAVFQYPTNTPRGGMWPAIHPVLLQHIRAHNSTILFVNSRLLCERLSRALNELAGEDLVRAHHGSVSHDQRAAIEDALKAGELPAIVATSSLELGIDMGAVDLVLLVESPGSVASGLQRVGRAGHQVGATSRGRILPKHRGDLLECAVVTRRMLQGQIERTALPRNCLDVLAQQVVAMVAERDWQVAALQGVLTRAGSYTTLSRSLLDAVLDMLSGRYPSDELSDLRPSLVWDRVTDTLSARKGTRLLAVLNGGTIPDRGTYPVRVGSGGPRVGELDEEMVYESRQGDYIVLGATTWRVEEILRDQVIVSPAPGRTGRLPFWRGESPGRPIELGRALGAFLRELQEQPPEAREAWVQAQAPLDERAARNLVALVTEQEEATERLPTDRQIIIERFRDELGDWRVCILTPFGRRVHQPWAIAIEQGLLARLGQVVQVLSSDDGIALRFADTDAVPDNDALFPDPDDLEDLVLAGLRASSVFSGRFRENAARALLLPRRSAKGRQPLWLQRRRAEALQASVSRFPAFPIVLETLREILQDVFDLPGLTELLREVRARAIGVHSAVTRRASPFARGLVFQYIASYLYDGDQPLAERKAAALALDRGLLAELLGRDELRDLLDPAAIDAVEQDLQALDPDRRVDHADALWDLLRRLGDLSREEIACRCAVDPGPLIDALGRRVITIRVNGVERIVVAENAARYRDALGVPLPAGLPAALLEPAERPVEAIVRRWARTHGPFTGADLAARYGWTVAQAEVILRGLEQAGELVHGALLPTGGGGGGGHEWCDPDVLRRIKRRTLAALRREVEPVGAEVLAAFLPGWQGLDTRKPGLARLQEVLAQLEGLPLPFSELESRLLPARQQDFQPLLLDQLGALGEIVWVGRGPLGSKDGLVALYRRDRVAALLLPPEPPTGLQPIHHTVLEALEQRGACFLVELVQRAGGDAAATHAALWDLVWAGIVTNDTFQPLRALVAGQSGSARMAGGRWSLVRGLLFDPPADTVRRHAIATMLLDRYGVVSRETAQAEELVGGWASLYPVLAAMEDAGRARRGWFVDGLGSAQFALPGAVDRLRAQRTAAPTARWLSATDPACAWGNLLPWPEAVVPESKPRRVAGARVALAGGQLVAWLAPGGRSLVLFQAALAEDHLTQAVTALKAELGYKSLVIDKVDGFVPRDLPWLDRLLQAGFKQDFKGLVLAR